MSKACKKPSLAAQVSCADPQGPTRRPGCGKSVDDLHRLEARALGRMMRELRQAAALSLARMSEETGLPPEHLLAIEDGRRPLPLRTFITVTDMADIPLDIAATEALTHLDRIRFPPEFGEGGDDEDQGPD